MLSKKQRLALTLLKDNKWKFGLDLVEESAGGFKRGMIYVTLAALEEKGFIRHEKGPTHPSFPHLIARNKYQITYNGRQALVQDEEVPTKRGFLKKVFGG